LQIKKKANGMIKIEGCEKRQIGSVDEANTIFAHGMKARQTRATEMNAESSRSHLIFSIKVRVTNRQTKQITTGKLSFVDLAGSESQKKTGTNKEGAKEAIAINKSLSALGNVIRALAQGKTSNIPYKESTLTRLMQDSLGGNSKTLMFVNVGPSSYNAAESANSMLYATEAKKIKNQPKLNVDTTVTLKLKKDMEKLMEKNEALLSVLRKHGLDTEVIPEESAFAPEGDDDDYNELNDLAAGGDDEDGEQIET